MTGSGAAIGHGMLDTFSCNRTCLLLQTPDEDAAIKAIKLAYDNGVNFFDVAPFYASGKAEEVRSLTGVREMLKS